MYDTCTNRKESSIIKEIKETFNYTYSASQQQEIKKIRKKYAQPTQAEDKLEQLRRLDRSVTKPGIIVALTVGIISILIFGVGLCCTIVWEDTMFIPGIFIGIIGLIGTISAYPIYVKIKKNGRKYYRRKFCD